MTRTVAFVCLLALGGATPARANDARALLSDAAANYRTGKFREAAALYEQAIRSGSDTPIVHYNLGNAYYKMGDVAHSVLEYERARRLDPTDEDVRANLAVALARAQDRVEPIPLLFVVRWWNDLKDRYPAWTLFVWTVLLAWLCAAAVFVFFGFSDVLVRRVALAFSIAFGAAFALSVALYLDAREDFEARRAAVVMGVSVPVHSAPDASGIESFTVHAGLRVEILEQKGPWFHVRLADGKNGWIETDEVERI